MSSKLASLNKHLKGEQVAEDGQNASLHKSNAKENVDKIQFSNQFSKANEYEAELDLHKYARGTLIFLVQSLPISMKNDVNMYGDPKP